jgi:Zn-finger nucleic acid-binding protein
MDAGHLTCPSCGSSVEQSAVRCRYCDTQLQTTGCPECFALSFLGTKHCPACGTKLPEGITSIVKGDARPTCPRCRIELSAMALGGTFLDQCDRCGGLWVDQPAFDAICAHRELGAAIRDLGGPATGRANPVTPDLKPNQAAYIPCAQCGKLMNRSNFAHISGVIIDSCKPHGTWFDKDELSRIIEFIRSGGLDHARERQKRELDEARRKLEAERRAQDATRGLDAPVRQWGTGHPGVDAVDLLWTIGSAISKLSR